MFFSKFFLPLFALAGVASVAFATPIAAPQPAAIEARDNLEARQLGALGILNGLLGTVTPILGNLQSTGQAGGDVTGIVGSLVGALGGATTSLGGAPAPPAGDVTAIISVTITIVLNIFGVLNSFPIVGGLLTLVVNAVFSLVSVLILIVPTLLISLLSSLLGAGLPIGIIGGLLSLLLGLLGL